MHPSSDSPPNILVFLTDQQRWDTLGCYGQKLNLTPNLDQMAAEGVRFEHAFTCQPVCGPARSCLQTGRYATETGCFHNGIALPGGEKTIAHWLSQAGYEVGYIGKWHLGASDDEPGGGQAVRPHRQGGYKDHWLAADLLEVSSHGDEGHLYDAAMNRVDFEGYRVDCTTDFVIDYLRSREGGRPFFLFVSYLEPHQQNDRNCYEGPAGSKQKYRDYQVPGDLVDTLGDWREHFPDYLGCCASLDENLGRLRRELESLSLADNTFLLYTSDHGCHFRTRNDEYKRSCHEASIHVPMIAYGPGFKGGNVISELVSLIDLPPTLLYAGGVERPDTMRGRPLQSLVDGGAADWPQEVFIQISESQVGRAVRTARWKYCICVDSEDANVGWKQPGSDLYTERYLYDLERDPHERNNLVRDAKHAPIRAQLAATLKRRMAEAGEAPPRYFRQQYDARSVGRRTVHFSMHPAPAGGPVQTVVAGDDRALSRQRSGHCELDSVRRHHGV